MWLLLWVLVPLLLGTARGLPCCSGDYEMIHIENAVYCSDFNSLITVYKWCDVILLVDPQTLNKGEVFLENPLKTEYTLDNQTWDEKYCTGTFSKNFSLATDKSMVNTTNKTVAMICSTEDDVQHYSLYATCLLISSVFLLATVVIYLWLPELRDLQGKCVLCFIFSLMIGYICLVYLQLPSSSPDLHQTDCIVIAFLTYFWMMSAFFWLNINSFNMWRSAVLAHINMSERRLMFGYYVAGWGAPLCFLCVALVTHNLPGDIIRPNFGITSCWFPGKLELWSFFYGPVLVLLIFNIVYFISTALYLWADYRSPNPMPRIKSLRIKFCLYFKLFLIMGITWIFEILSTIDNEPWYVTDILNCFQGVIIFVVMIVLRKRVWRLLGAKQLCGITLGHCWRWDQMEDEETINELVDEQQLSNTNNSKQ
ncbi:G-protein coupled receptor Mth2-like [Macrosteles quadrilineatus]|uniref:G-protein coupled receptor Mth2-like n=1 Tax=Macrosteles quadrilineatus TaxID=74068 RepID=UPI0023E2922B|nr:G-protein coupled receptor Mth2-like [Macrosteles quadrilineatus]